MMKLCVFCLLTLTLTLTLALGFGTSLSVLEVPKMGSCPASSEKIVICVIECNTDLDCRGALKCCPTGCGKTCQRPVFGCKPGSCPAPIPHLLPCDDECSSDSDCNGNFKCCYSGCGLQCLLLCRHDIQHDGLEIMS